MNQQKQALQSGKTRFFGTLEEALKVNDALISSIGEGVIIIDEYGVIDEVNRVATEMLGYNKSEMLGKWLPELLPSKDKTGKDIPTEDRPALRSLMLGHADRQINTYLKKDGTPFPVDGTASPFIVDGKPRGSIIVFKDVSREMAVEKAKDEFVSLASHQLRTPLTSIRLYLDLLKGEAKELSSEGQNHLRKIEAATITMLELVDDFLNISKLELGRLELRRIKLDVSELIREQVARLQNIAEDNDINLTCSLPKEGIIIRTDRKLLSEAVYNLLTNAIRYRNRHIKTPKIEVKLTTKGDQVIISVKDNGIGIPLNAQPQIFERLYRAENAVETQSDGTGLGLYLVKEIVNALGGDISFVSQEAKGTTFMLNLPKKSR